MMVVSIVLEVVEVAAAAAAPPPPPPPPAAAAAAAPPPAAAAAAAAAHMENLRLLLLLFLPRLAQLTEFSAKFGSKNVKSGGTFPTWSATNVLTFTASCTCSFLKREATSRCCYPNCQTSSSKKPSGRRVQRWKVQHAKWPTILSCQW